MKLIKRILTTCLSLSIAILSLIMGLASGEKSLGASPSFTYALTAPSTDEVQDTLFLINPEFVRASDNYVYVYDSADQTIKIIDKQTNYYRETNNHFIPNNAINDILVYNDALLLFSKEANSFTAIDSETLEVLTFDQTLLTTLSTAKEVKSVTINQEDYILLCPENPITSDFELIKVKKVDQVLEIQSVSKFKLDQSLQASLSSYSSLFVDATDAGLLFLLFITGENNILSTQIDPTSVNAVETNITAVTGLSSAQNILDVSAVTFADQTEAVAVTLANEIKFFSLAIGSELPITVSLTEMQDRAIAIDNSFVVSDANGKGSTLALISNSTQELKIIDFSKQEAPYYQEQEVKNQEIIETLYTKENYQYLSINKDTPILSLPYSKEGQITALKNENLVVIGKGQEASGNAVHGWDYVMYSKDNVNYYGYVSSFDTSPLTSVTYDRDYVTVYAYTRLYSLPSKISDSKNIEIKTIPTYSRLEVLDSLCDYTSLSTKYLLVKVNGEDVGYIDRASVISVSDTSNRIIPNATVTHNDSEIFTSTDENRQTILYLDKGARVKVIGKRDTITNFTKVTFNDQDGNVYTGYIYTYNLEADSWTMLQTIGVLLVLINVVILIIIICLKNKVTR